MIDTTRTILVSWDGGTIFTFQADGMETFIADLATTAPNMGPAGIGSNPSVEFALRSSGTTPTGNMSVAFDDFRCANSSGVVCAAP